MSVILARDNSAVVTAVTLVYSCDTSQCPGQHLHLAVITRIYHCMCFVRVNRDDFFTLRSCSTRGHPYKIF